jgi:hypothetical protein
MSDAEDTGGPSLEPPSLFGRKKRGKKTAPRSGESTAAPPAAEPIAGLDADIRPEVEPVPPPPVEATPTTSLGVDQPTVVQPSVSSGPAAPPPGPPPPLFADEPRQPAPRTAAPQAPVPAEVPPEVPTTPRAPRGPWLTGWAAAIVTGLVVGGLIVGGTSASLRLCTAVKGTESCGNPGFLLLVAILVVCVLVGAVMLRAARVPEPGSTSFLAVGLLSVVALMFLIDQLLEWWMVIVIPVVSILTYVLSHWVTSSFVEPATEVTEDAGEGAPELRDVR